VGDGFTDWNSLKAAPARNRLGFEIPRPTKLGYYDLTSAATRKSFTELANNYGIDGFVYHHYWFYDPEHPGPNLHRPLTKMLEDGHPDVPFFFNWCAVKWTATWSGKLTQNVTLGGNEKDVLQKQFFPDVNDPTVLSHYQWLRQFFQHPNYIKVKGQPSTSPDALPKETGRLSDTEALPRTGNSRWLSRSVHHSWDDKDA